MILVIDNYDSFTYNLVQYLLEYEADIRVYKNDCLCVQTIWGLNPRGIVLSPGPGGPEDAGICVDIVRKLAGDFSILGVCLGHQVLAHAFGGRVVLAKEVRHGKTSLIYHDGNGVYKGLKNPFLGTRYHSLMVEKESLSDEFYVSAEVRDGTIMGIRHKEYALEGVQFHPESILSECGKEMMGNFVNSLR